MATRTEFMCDGCGDVRLVDGGKPADWRLIAVTLEGFSGYPVGDDANGERVYDLCPACQRRLHEVARPTRWARVERPAKSSRSGGET
jgi:hypothetical protein